MVVIPFVEVDIIRWGTGAVPLPVSCTVYMKLNLIQDRFIMNDNN